MSSRGPDTIKVDRAIVSAVRAPLIGPTVPHWTTSRQVNGVMHVGKRQGYVRVTDEIYGCLRCYYNVVTDDLAELLGRPPKTVRWALHHYPHVPTS